MVFTDIERVPLSVRWHQLAVFLFVGALLMLPLGLGGNRPLPLALCQTVMAGAFLIMACVPGQPSRPWPKRLKVALWLFLLTLLWAVFQGGPFSPVSWHNPLWKETSEILHRPYHGSISLSPDSTMTAVNRLLTYGLMLAGVFSLTRNSEYAAQAVRWFWYISVALCAYGIASYILDFSPFLLIEKTDYKMDVTSTFVNRNHFADYAGMALMTGTGLAWKNFQNRQLYAISENQGFNFWSWLVWTGMLYITGLAIALLSLIMTHSRAGVVSSFVGLSVFAGAYLLYRKNYRMALNAPLICVLVASCIVAIFFQYGRFSNLLTDGTARFDNYDDVMDLVRAHPWIGYGLGSFERTFMMHYDPRFLNLYHRAHSDWLEMFFDLGLFGGMMLATSVALSISGCWHGIRTRRRSGLYPALGLGASALLLTHALFDFSLQIPGLVAAWSVLLGAGLAQSWSLHEKSSHGEHQSESERPAFSGY